MHSFGERLVKSDICSFCGVGELLPRPPSYRSMYIGDSRPVFPLSGHGCGLSFSGASTCGCSFISQSGCLIYSLVTERGSVPMDTAPSCTVTRVSCTARYATTENIIGYNASARFTSSISVFRIPALLMSALLFL